MNLKRFIELMEKAGEYKHLITPVVVLIVIFMFLVPMPTFVLDTMIAFNFTLTLIILMAVMYMDRPTAFSSFPSVLMMTTLFRLSLNVASTRVILLRGHEGTSAAGGMIEAFGQFVAGGEYAIGIVIFIILIIIQMVVINTGSSRIAEVTARFTLDAMPGKQMSIDADLNSGLITEEEAKRRRQELQDEADFYGAMDGSIKFVSKDAMAGLLITGINIIGGLTIGTLRHQMPLSEAASTFIILTIGDGLVSALPSLFISVSGGVLTTRATAKKSMGEDISDQLTNDKKPLFFVAGTVAVLGIVTPLPTVIFLSLAVFIGALAYFRHSLEGEGFASEPQIGPGGAPPTSPAQVEGGKKPAALPEPEKVEKLLKVDMMGLEVGYALISLVDAKKGGNILERIKSIRRQLALEIGIIVPPIRIRDNLQLNPNQYQVLIKGIPLAQGELMINHFLAMNPGTAAGPIDGVQTREPAFGLDAYWIKEAQKDEAQMMGYTVVDLQTVVTTHLSEIIKSHASELLGRQETQNLLDNLAETYPKIVEDLVPSILSLGVVQKVLQNLLNERVSVRDLLTILETLAEAAGVTKDPGILTELVRQGIGRVVIQPYLNERNELSVITLNPQLEHALTENLQETDQGNFISLDPQTAQKFLERLQGTIQSSAFAIQPILLVNPSLRQPLRRLLERVLPNLVLLSQSEVPGQVSIITVGVVGAL